MPQCLHISRHGSSTPGEKGAWNSGDEDGGSPHTEPAAGQTCCCSASPSTLGRQPASPPFTMHRWYPDIAERNSVVDGTRGAVGFRMVKNYTGGFCAPTTPHHTASSVSADMVGFLRTHAHSSHHPSRSRSLSTHPPSVSLTAHLQTPAQT